MNSTVRTLRLRNLMAGPEGWGRAAGIKMQQALRTRIDAAPAPDLVRLSLDGVTRLDVTFAAEALVAQVRHYRGVRSLCVVDLPHEDVTENVAAAADRMAVPVTLWRGEAVQMAGPVPGASVREALDFALGRPRTCTRDLAATLGLSVTNASTRLKLLWEQGYLMRAEIAAASGGTEFIYARIG